jgi:hypothetical protein
MLNEIQTIEDRYELILALHRKMSKDGEPMQEDIDAFREIVKSDPTLWSRVRIVSDNMRLRIVNMITDGESRAWVLAELDAIRQQLALESATELERLLVDSILSARVRLLFAEHRHTELIIESSITAEEGLWWDRFLSAAHRRYLRAIETLARVRRLTKGTPYLQVNIAQKGGKQINLQGNQTRNVQLPLEGIFDQ